MKPDELTNARVLVFGDVMLDEYVTGVVSRVSPEAPIPVLLRGEHHASAGGAANVAANINALGGKAILVGLIGEDAPGDELEQILARAPGIETRLVRDSHCRTTIKTRFLAGGQHLLRVDQERQQSRHDYGVRLVAAAEAALANIDIVIVSDYGKGIVSAQAFAALAAAARAAGKIVIVDPKQSDFSFYRGAHYLTPNLKELAQATGHSVASDDAIAAACRAAADTSGANLLVTRSERGMSLALPGEPLRHVRASAREVFDVSGAGDTAVATFGAALATGHSPEQAMILANAAAGLSVAKRGTAVVTARELSDYLAAAGGPHEATLGPMPLDQAVELRRLWRERGLRVGFTNGCFDILHPGHVKLLAEAAARCDRLIVGLNSDRSVRALKGASRPVNNSEARGAVLAALRSVDAVVVFDEDTPSQVIDRLKPDLLVKGGDYTKDTIVGAREVELYGGEVMIVPLVAGHSTTAILAHRKEAAQ
ncbi:bifunctional protein HldE [Variibacter gotjawalensis]|uniref:Bifunctional protein HldE n=1 Tax=Variibacter gotjawalensis TaxID=1333996 RepID=A0A0S3PTN2_9BRAD|nr:D-glycero-beta-D-manno-heptose 1-phosphate adenylyltransferase [Variibacter gotjawalensis]NIK49567.1 D-beta-D-heptose 7-phosphate kinase/D-beta-D-heptose 1-phosphate adenosyltransferase [Variibacter gotjawalensis]RZS45578.1 D-alpha,beta-D-heptose 7-phosphate 1-kinase /D-beta-D-heptose 1-phosphate adenylyltransferase [Variibacter gotjawalensis]BAT59251.1 bifunctional protein HldE [Variibacter gotjawalensis]